MSPLEDTTAVPSNARRGRRLAGWGSLEAAVPTAEKGGSLLTPEGEAVPWRQAPPRLGSTS